MAFGDFLWSPLEKIGLADFFEDHDIPPIFFLLLLLAILIPLSVSIVYWLGDGGGGEPALESCGDGICQTNLGESAVACPQDCAEEPSGLKTVIVEIVGDVRSNIEVRIKDEDDYLVQLDTGLTNQFTMTGLEEERVKASVRNPYNGRIVSSDLVELRVRITKIPLGLPPSFFEADTTTAPPTKGTLKVTVRDANTNELIEADVAVVVPAGSSYLLVKSQVVDGTGYFTLDAGQWYAVLADSPGYTQFNNLENPVKLQGGMEIELIVSMEVPSLDAEMALINVCVRNQSGGTVAGSVDLFGIIGSKLRTQALSSDGCTTFELPPNGVVTLSTAQLPSGCLDAASGAVQLRAGVIDVNLTVSCDPNAQGRVRVKVLGENDTILTQDASITAWYANDQQISGNGPGRTLGPGVAGYTQFVDVASSMPFRFIIANLQGYATHTSSEYTVAPFENKSITIRLTKPPLPVLNITFQGVSYPNPILPGRAFNLIVPTVLYGQTVVTDSANVTVELAGQPCQISKDGAWIAECIAPLDTGEYEISITASYEGRSGETVKRLSVLQLGQSLFTLTPHAILDTRPPIDLEMDITFNGTPLDSLTDSQVTIIYEDGDIMVTDLLKLSGGDGLYAVRADSPFSGAHRAEILLNKIIYGKIYEQNFTMFFTSTPTSVEVTAEERITPLILEPEEDFTVDLRVENNGVEVSDLINIFFTLRGQKTNIPWNPEPHTYQKGFIAPTNEGIYPVLIELGAQALTNNKKIYVVDTTREKAGQCEISNCQTIPQVRKCVHQHKNEDRYSEQETIGCIESGWIYGGTGDVSHCLTSSGNRGDWNDNCRLDSSAYANDVSIMTEFLRRVPGQQDRDGYLGCGDMDNDGDVDTDDLTCLKNVVAMKWFGDRGDGTCSAPMRGGFCLDINVGIPGDFDNDDDITQEDVNIIGRIVATAAIGVLPPQDLLSVADLDGDGIISNSDKSCVEDLAGSGNVPIECLRAYDFGCDGTKGDLNQNGEIEKMDLFLEKLLVEGRVDSSSVMECADMTDDGILNENDLLCLGALVKDETEDVERYCTACQKQMHALGRGGAEICNDGLDNDCDDGVDEDCSCDSSQKCTRKYDNDGLYNTDDFKYCRSLSWHGGGYKWYFPSDYEACFLDRGCETRACEGKEQVCSSSGGGGEDGEWFGEAPKETDDPDDDPRSCEDEWDNDCEGGDEKCDRGSSSCFPAGTPIAMANGSVTNIEDVSVGDFVLSYDIDAKETAVGEVLELESPIRYHLYTLIFENGDTLRLTSEHPLYARGKGWSSIDPGATYGENGQTVLALETGDEILTIGGGWLRITDVTYQDIQEGVQTYNLKAIRYYNNFYAGGLLAHNKW